eukprot:2683664-Rhodomonas_salina.1
MSIIGANIPNAINLTGKTCYLCSGTSHLASACVLSAPVRIGEPFPGWTAQGVKKPECWLNATDITPACAGKWIDYLQRHGIVTNPDPTNTLPSPDFATLAAQP